MIATSERMSIQEFHILTSCNNPEKISGRKISVAEFDKFQVSYFRDGRSKYLRFGQAFLNEKYPSDINPELFYCNIVSDAINLIYKHYIEAS